MNKYYNYPNIELWQQEAWLDRYSKIGALAEWTSAHGIVEGYNGEYGVLETKDGAVPEYFKAKTKSIETPEFKQYWKTRGLIYESHEMGGNLWLTMIPSLVLENPDKKRTVLVVEHLENSMDPNWAMRTIDCRREYQELALREGLILVYNVRSTPDNTNGYATILSEALVLYPGDFNQIMLDVSHVYKNGLRLKDIQDFVYKAEGKTADDPDMYVHSYGDIYAINISGQYGHRISSRWEWLTRFNGGCDFEALKHSDVGRKIAESMVVEYNFDASDDPEWSKYWDNMGLDYCEHFTKGERWLSLIPKGFIKSPNEKMPFIALMTEVNAYSNRLPVTALATYYEYCKMAARGDFALLFFALESPDANELWCDIVNEAVELYPLDRSKFYMLGQSHNGHFTREFATRHADILAAAATLSNGHGLVRPEFSHEAVHATDARVEALSRVDMPLINLQGHNEAPPYPMDMLADSWARRLKASNCPVKTYDEVRAAVEGGSYVERFMQLTADKTEVVFIDGIECCIAHLKNNDGKYHFCAVELDNTPHYPAPTMAELAWNFMRRFARDLESGEVIELF